uniref:Secreted protein n=1 Tax=Echinococcus canadensis TaxID=519352 RepID=A0A915EW17_9CEST
MPVEKLNGPMLMFWRFIRRCNNYSLILAFNLFFVPICYSSRNVLLPSCSEWKEISRRVRYSHHMCITRVPQTDSLNENTNSCIYSWFPEADNLISATVEVVKVITEH